MPKKMSEELTAAQRETLNLICRFIDERDVPPTYRELAEEIGIGLPSVQDRLNGLIKKGYIEKERGTRTIRVRRRSTDSRSRVVAIPLFGSVVAGNPLRPDVENEGVVYIDRSVADPASCYAVRVSGESMIDAGIKNGDILIIHCQRMANDGDIVIASVNNELTVKRLRCRKGVVQLEPANSMMAPIEIAMEDDFRILGVVLNENCLSRE